MSMTPPMPDYDALVKRLRELEQAATPGPWINARVENTSASGPAEPFSMWTDAGPRSVAVGRSTCIHADDMELIVAMRNELPALLDAIEALRREREPVATLLANAVNWRYAHHHGPSKEIRDLTENNLLESVAAYEELQSTPPSEKPE